jgi:hypothetical protein
MLRYVLGILCVCGAASTATPDRVRQSATKAAAIIQASQKNWYAKQSCAPGHHQILPAMAFRATRGRGIAVNETAARQDAARADAYPSKIDTAAQYTEIIDRALGGRDSLRGAEATGVRLILGTAIYEHHRRAPVRRRPLDHHGPAPSAILQPRYRQDHRHAGRADVRAHPSVAADSKARIDQARTWHASAQARVTEDRSVQLLGLTWAGAVRARLDRFARELKAAQQSGGGWSSHDSLASEAYSSSEALAALELSGDSSIVEFDVFVF